jgi:TonB family protein
VRNLATAVTVQAHALTWMAVVQQDAGQFAEAESLFQTAGSMEDPASVDAAYTKELYGRFLRQQNRVNEAEPLEARAQEIRKEHIAQLMTRRPAAERQAFASSVYRVGGGVTAPSVVQKLEPSYSEEARAAKLSGTVLVRVVIGTDGKASDIELLRGLGLGLDEQAVFAISQWQFKPGTKDGVPVPVQAQIEVNFRLL